ncbi:M14 family metallopeptidase [Thalassotalea montiporae]
MSQYPIGKLGQKWGDEERALWLENQSVKRSYQDEVEAKINKLASDLTVESNAEIHVESYGTLAYHTGGYKLWAIKSANWSNEKKTVLVTGGVHGYETSGVQGAIRFAETKMADYAAHYNILVLPCLSPWGYETINRWNPEAIDPNRSFYEESPAQESALAMAYVASLGGKFDIHIDLHETTDSDNSEFRPALAAREGATQTNWNIPDGFYLVGDSENPQPAFQQAIIAAVAQVTHIAPADENGEIIGAPLEQHGVINYAYKKLGLCAGLANANFATTTEVYPDSPKVDDENCILAQVAAITSGLDYVIERA